MIWNRLHASVPNRLEVRFFVMQIFWLAVVFPVVILGYVLPSICNEVSLAACSGILPRGPIAGSPICFQASFLMSENEAPQSMMNVMCEAVGDMRVIVGRTSSS